jgi:hypothetical protein
MNCANVAFTHVLARLFVSLIYFLQKHLFDIISYFFFRKVDFVEDDIEAHIFVLGDVPPYT